MEEATHDYAVGATRYSTAVSGFIRRDRGGVVHKVVSISDEDADRIMSGIPAPLIQLVEGIEIEEN